MILTKSILKNKINELLAKETTTANQREILCILMDSLIKHYQKNNPKEIHGYCLTGNRQDPTRREYF
jgi:hypothetical protein